MEINTVSWGFADGFFKQWGTLQQTLGEPHKRLFKIHTSQRMPH